ncbi:endonuclease NucS domain-containing protein [Nesterenkonia marinintestina]|uniref:endonuclease NucS domain-containing protein n=1 Tax=Nesterenkonia marinintestina TaxID=2979865 RepID=UPI0021C14E76|nr:endonuclease NucS domain-containing protein [Nesterenkonia sp. GX14115]
MPVEMRMWRIDGDEPMPLVTSRLPAESDLHEFLKRDPSLLGERLLVIGSEVITPHGPRLDLLAIDVDGNLHLLELKRDKTPREVVAQVLDYGSWVSTLSREDVIDIATQHLAQPFEAAFEDVFGSAPPDELNGDLNLTIVAAELDASSERIVNYLRDFGVPVSAVFFSYLEDDGRCYLARSWLVSSDDESPTAAAGNKKSKRAPWNGMDWYVSFGGDRVWEDARRFNFISAGQGKFYSQTIRSLPEGARVWVNVPSTGFVGVGITVRPATRFEEARVRINGQWQPLDGQQLATDYRFATAELDDDDAEWVVPVEWIDARPQSDAYWEKGMFASQHSACKLRQEFTLGRLAAHFNLDDGE